jgi:hypothetical protein
MQTERRNEEQKKNENERRRKSGASVLKAGCGGESQGWVTAVIMTVMSHDAESSNEMMTL